MTQTASSFDFVPQATQDREILEQLGFLPGVKEFLMVRQVHALEHATVWVLTEFDRRGELLGGMSTEQGFYLYGSVNPQTLQQAVYSALNRITSGEWNLAVHPRCGTNLSVALLLTAGFTLGVNWLMPKDPLGQLLGVGVAAMSASQLAPDLGPIAQRYVTTAIPFNLEIVRIEESQDMWGKPAHFVRVRWQD
ncbi:MAG: hypothetical protein J7545_20355 [Roseofilum sp. SBFL]|nr:MULTISPECIES: DUF6391 domain-containing protein [unclassified Roseofilum]MBP0014577.1 hypothetical protein [Roseofilum sp. SID3]MBP0026070.1 hypothetical protein [Roseofilum sp. SID2]MBP0038273.1 hypothetical protein [Roseofilum sp. SID1]MBP0044294.1 hypothetical protein [Roseofilum sp. SBFL]